MAVSSGKVTWDLAREPDSWDTAGNSLVLCKSKTTSVREGLHAVISGVLVGGVGVAWRDANFLERVSADRSAAPSASGPFAMHGRRGKWLP